MSVAPSDYRCASHAPLDLDFGARLTRCDRRLAARSDSGADGVVVTCNVLQHVDCRLHWPLLHRLSASHGRWVPRAHPLPRSGTSTSLFLEHRSLFSTRRRSNLCARADPTLPPDLPVTAAGRSSSPFAPPDPPSVLPPFVQPSPTIPSFPPATKRQSILLLTWSPRVCGHPRCPPLRGLSPLLPYPKPII